MRKKVDCKEYVSMEMLSSEHPIIAKKKKKKKKKLIKFACQRWGWGGGGLFFDELQ
jgi:hypothetical protein